MKLYESITKSLNEASYVNEYYADEKTANDAASALKEKHPDWSVKVKPENNEFAVYVNTLPSKSMTEDEDSEREEAGRKYEKDKELRMQLANSVDIQPLVDKLRQLSGISDLELSKEVRDERGYIYIDLASKDILEYCGIFKLALSSCIICSFNTQVVTDGDTGRTYWWGTIELRYQAKSLGRNGVDILRFSYGENKDSEWLFNEA